MKKLLCVFICILFLGGCSGEKTREVKKEPLNITGFKSTVTTVMNDISVSAEVTYVPYNSLEFEFIAPSAVSGMTVSCKDGEYELKAHGMTFTVSGDKMPFNMLCRALEDCLNSASGALPETTADGGAVYKYQSGNRQCELYCDGDTCALKKLTVDGADMLLFENFTFLGQTE